MKRRAWFCLFGLCCILLSGCWDYRGMDELNIVAGLAVDKSESGGYMLTVEIVDVSAIGEGDRVKAIVVCTEGPTLFEAIRNTKKRLYNKLYFGSMRTIVISQEVAEEYGVLKIIHGFLRDEEPRETIMLVVSKEKTAREIICSPGLDMPNVSYEIAEIIEEDNKVDSTSKKVQMYEAYNILHGEGIELILPAFHLVRNKDKDAVEIDGIAIFKGDKLDGFLSPDDTHYFAMITDKKVGGAVSLPYSGRNAGMVSMEIINCNHKTTFDYSEGAIDIFVTVDIKLGVIEFPTYKTAGKEGIYQVKIDVEKFLERRICEVFYKIQKEFGHDIYGYGKKIYEDRYPLWKNIRNEWNELFRQAAFHVTVKATMVDVGLIL